MLLAIKNESTLIDSPVEVHCELGNSCDWFVDGKKMGLSIGVGNYSGNAEVTIKPGVIEDASVHLHIELPPIK
jgi:hypothetical protein